MEPLTTLGTAITTIFLTKALEKTGEKFGEAVITKGGEAIPKIRKHSPETAKALEEGDPTVLNLGKAKLESIEPDPIFAELVAAADAEENATFQAKLQEFKQTKQIALQKNISAEEIEAEIEQKTVANSKGVKQIGASEVDADKYGGVIDFWLSIHRLTSVLQQNEGKFWYLARVFTSAEHKR